MKANTKTWLTAAAITGVLAFCALVYFLYPGLVVRSGLDNSDLGGGAMAALILWLVLRKKQPLSQPARIVLGVAVAVGLLLGLAVFSMS